MFLEARPSLSLPPLKKCCDQCWGKGGESGGISGNAGEVLMIRFAAVFAVILTVSGSCAERPDPITNQLLCH
jgi:hypothetical protein